MPFSKIGFSDFDGILRGKYLNDLKLKNHSKIEFCDVVFGWDMHDQCYPKDHVTGWGIGFPDGLLSIDPTSERTIPWENDRLFYLGDFSEDERLSAICPRTLLKKVIQEYRAIGLYPKVGFEYEWFNFKRTESTLSDPKENVLTNGMFGYSLLKLDQNGAYVEQLLRDLSNFGLSIEGLHTETGPGVYEAALSYTDALEAADQAALFKYGVKSIAAQNDLIASFMAKWSSQYPGCGGHVHISLHDEAGRSVFNEEVNDSSKQFLAGVLEGIMPLFSVYAPISNSYKRFAEGSWAATAVNWGVQNRTTAIRIVPERVTNRHMEMRIPGADTNPYLVLYAILASGLYGIKNKMDITMSACNGNAYEKQWDAPFPSDLGTAIEWLGDKYLKVASEMVNNTFLDHLIMTRQFEWQQHQPNEDWERERYFEIV